MDGDCCEAMTFDAMAALYAPYVPGLWGPLESLAVGERGSPWEGPGRPWELGGPIERPSSSDRWGSSP